MSAGRSRTTGRFVRSPGPKDPEKESEVTKEPDSTEERYEGDTQERSWDAKVNAAFELFLLNAKRTYDEYQDVALTEARRSQTHLDEALVQARRHAEEIHNVTLQLLQNAVETANMVSKQTIRHADFAIDQQWNLEPHEAAAEAQVLPSFYLDLIKSTAASVATEILAAMSKKEAE